MWHLDFHAFQDDGTQQSLTPWKLAHDPLAGPDPQLETPDLIRLKYYSWLFLLFEIVPKYYSYLLI